MDEQLLIQFLLHRCTAEETEQIDRWIKADKANAEWIFEMERIWDLKGMLRFSDSHQIELAYQQFLNDIQTKKASKTKRLFPWRMLKNIAAILLLILIPLNIYYWNYQKEKTITMNTIEVPKGQRVSIQLSDGTNVWLNADSKLTYPSAFSDKNRDVYLTGEAYFEVKRNEHSPFIVHTTPLNVKVLGTVFNVKSYKNENTEVVLAKGKVEVSESSRPDATLQMKPNEQIVYSPKTGMTLNKEVDANALTCWTVGEVYYKNQFLQDITQELTEKFGIPIQIRDKELGDIIFTCHAQADASLIQILNLLKETRKIDYRQNENRIIVFKPLKKKAYEVNGTEIKN
ncbi:MAG: FecR family protein [Tannerellaceae bacterium]